MFWMIKILETIFFPFNFPPDFFLDTAIFSSYQVFGMGLQSQDCINTFFCWELIEKGKMKSLSLASIFFWLSHFFEQVRIQLWLTIYKDCNSSSYNPGLFLGLVLLFFFYPGWKKDWYSSSFKSMEFILGSFSS